MPANPKPSPAGCATSSPNRGQLTAVRSPLRELKFDKAVCGPALAEIKGARCASFGASADQSRSAKRSPSSTRATSALVSVPERLMSR